MGAWGIKLYQDDVACDIKEEYVDRLKIGQSNIDATQEVINNNIDCINDIEDGPIFWLALADTQWKYGRLLQEVKKEALKHIKCDLKRWEANKTQCEKRAQELKKIEERLNSPQPPEKKVTKLILNKATWEVGDILLYQIHNEASKYTNKYILLRVIGISRTNIGSLPREYSHEQNVIAIYNWTGSELPNLNIIKNLKFIIGTNMFKKQENIMAVLSFNKKALKKLDIKVILKDNKYKKASESTISTIGIPWLNIYNMDNMFENALNVANENGTLIGE